MAGLENILEIISSQQKKNEDSIISAAEKKAESITAEGNEKAAKEYDEYIKRATAQLRLDFENAKSSTDAQMRRRILSYKVKCIDDIIEKTLRRLDSLPDEEYFAVLGRLAKKKADSGRGVLFLNKRDLDRVTEDFRKMLDGLDVEISEETADIENGFILRYGLISENCSFRAIIEAERDGVRDIVSGALFRQVKK